MNWPLLVPLLITTGLAIIGWFVAHWLAAVRDRNNKRREMRLSVLIEAYRALAFSAARQYDAQTAPRTEGALADVLLLGSAKQVEMALTLMKEFAASQSFDWTPLLSDLRRDLRAELKLDHVESQIAHIRFVERKLDV
jgi:hypothetical protein